MSKGEKAVLHITSDYGYGASGAGGVIPPNADLDFEGESSPISTSYRPKDDPSRGLSFLRCIMSRSLIFFFLLLSVLLPLSEQSGTSRDQLEVLQI